LGFLLEHLALRVCPGLRAVQHSLRGVHMKEPASGNDEELADAVADLRRRYTLRDILDEIAFQVDK